MRQVSRVADRELNERKGDRRHSPGDSHGIPHSPDVSRTPVTTDDVVKEGRRGQQRSYVTCRTPSQTGPHALPLHSGDHRGRPRHRRGLAAPGFAQELKPIGTGFVNLIKMMISPIIFCTIVLGIGSVRKAAKVGAVGGIALVYFLVMSLVALTIGLIVGNVLDPGTGLAVTDAVKETGHAQVDAEAQGTTEFLLGIIPTTIVSAFTEGEVLQALLIALLCGFALQAMGPAGRPILRGIEHIQRLVFRVLAMIMWAAPIGAFGAIAAVTGSAGLDALKSLAVLMLGFYVTCVLFVFVVLGALLRVVSGINAFALFKYLGREFLLILSTSSSESALPRLIAKMEHLGVSKPVVGITVPTGYSFNLDGTMIYMTMASLFIADAMGTPMSVGEQIPLLLFLLVASKGAAGVTGAGLATLAGGLQSHKPALVDGVGLIVGIDRFMSEARALTNFAGNAVATVLIGTWTKEIDKARVDEVLAGRIPSTRRRSSTTVTAARRGPTPTARCRSRAARRSWPGPERRTGRAAGRPGRSPSPRRPASPAPPRRPSPAPPGTRASGMFRARLPPCPARLPRVLPRPHGCPRGSVRLGPRVGDLPQPDQGLPELCHPPPTEVGRPLALHLGDDRVGHLLGGQRPRRQAHQPGPPVGRVRHPRDIPGLLELVDQEARGLLGDLRLLGQLGQPGAGGPDALQDAGLGGREVVEAGLRERGEDPVLQRPVGEEQEHARAEFA